MAMFIIVVSVLIFVNVSIVSVLISVNGFVSKIYIQPEASASVDVWHSAFLLSNTFPVTPAGD